MSAEPSPGQVSADYALARALAEQEAQAARIEHATSRRREWEAYEQMRQVPLYYGTWRSPGYRPVLVYKDRDHCMDVWILVCIVFWIVALFITLIIVAIYT